MPISGFGNDFFDVVMGTARDNLAGFVSQLPAFPDVSTPLPTENLASGAPLTFDFGGQMTGAPLDFGFGFDTAPNPFADLPFFGPTAGRAGEGGLGSQLTGLINNARQGAVQVRAAEAAAAAPAPVAAPAQGRPGVPNNGVYKPSRTDTRIAQKIDQAFRSRGLDPEFAMWVAEAEGGLDDEAAARRNRGGSPAFGPFQLWTGGPSSPGVGDEALAAGIDPRDPNSWERQIEFVADYVARNGWGKWEAVTARGIDPMTGVRAAAPAPASVPAGSIPPPEQSAGGTPITAPSNPAAPVGLTEPPKNPTAWEQAYGRGNLTPDQYVMARSEGMDEATADAVCGPAAAIAFARANGRSPTMSEALALAREVGWTARDGMAGIYSQSKLLTKLGIGNHVVEGAPDWRQVAQQVMAGNPVIINATGHYLVAEGYDPQTGAFDFGNSARILRTANHQSKFRPEDLPGLSSRGLTIAPRGVIYMTGGRGQR